MEKVLAPPNNTTEAANNGSAGNKYKEQIATLPSIKKSNGEVLYFHEHFWNTPVYLEGVMQVQEQFKPERTDIFLCTLPKSGTTWLKALGAAIFTRKHLEDPSHPLSTKLSHEIVPFMELDLFPEPVCVRDPEIPLLCTHIPYASLPKSIVDSDCKLVYLCRDPKDVFVSFWHFYHKVMNFDIKGASLDEAFEMYCNGTFHCGPFWDHILGYWKASLEFPEKVMFLKFEDLKDDTVSNVKKLAEFMGYPITPEEEEKGVVEKIVDLCSFDKMVKVNTSGQYQMGRIATVDNKSFFRKGTKGDWKNLLTPEMAAKLDQITKEKFSGSGLSFDSDC